MQAMIGECVGTMVLIILGDGVVAGVLLNRSKAQNAGWMAIATGWMLAVLFGVIVSRSLGGPGSLNPAGTLSGIVTDAIPWQAGLLQIAGQFIGAFLGAVLVWLNYWSHWRETQDPSLKLAVFCTSPAIRQPAANLVSEVIGTAVLVFVAGAVNKLATGPGLEPWLVGSLVWAIGLSLGGTTGYAINPARDFSPRLAHFLLPIPGKGPSDWGYAWIPVVGPTLGAIIGAVIFGFLAAK
jgi:glycerol uptake facilitator protein